MQSETFHEPGESPDQPLAVFSAGQSNTWKHRNALRRSERFKHVMHALGRVMHWAMAERRAFMTKTMGVAPPTSKRVQQTLDSDLPHAIDADVDGVHAFEESEGSADDSMQHNIETHPKNHSSSQLLAAPSRKTMLLTGIRIRFCRHRCLPMPQLIWSMNAVSCTAFHASWLQKKLLP